jgi:peptidoglycan/LPS O-acetylase OafA/YrhL
MKGEGAPRAHYLDWLRILAVLLLFPFHTLRVFNNEVFYVKGAWSEAAGGVLGFISAWHMPLLFFLAGSATYLALQKRTGGEYAWERVKRLLVPFVFGFFILIPPQTWFGGRYNSGYADSYGHYLVSGDFLDWNVRDGGDYFGGFGIGHLWFIILLLVFSLIVLPLALWGARGRGVAKMQTLGRLLSRPWWWILVVVILFLGEAVPELGGFPVVFYLFWFVLGYLAVCDPRFVASAQRRRTPALAGGVALVLAWVLVQSLGVSLPDPSAQLAGMVVVRTAGSWLVVVGLLGFGRRYLDQTSGVQRYLAQGSYPLYILHQTVIVILAFYLVSMPMAPAAQAAILFVSAVVGSFALYEVVRRVGALRFLFGMKQAKRTRESSIPLDASRIREP